MTMTADHAALLRRVPLFAAMTDAAYERVAAISEPQHVAAGEVVTEQGDEGDAFYVLVDGTAEVRRDERPIKTLQAGDFFGEIALIDGRPRSATVVALSELHLLRISREQFLRLFDEQPATRHGILMALTERIRNDAPHPTD
jgi:CRP-like cAMP-binding protein